MCWQSPCTPLHLTTYGYRARETKPAWFKAWTLSLERTSLPLASPAYLQDGDYAKGKWIMTSIRDRQGQSFMLCPLVPWAMRNDAGENGQSLMKQQIHPCLFREGERGCKSGVNTYLQEECYKQVPRLLLCAPCYRVGACNLFRGGEGNEI